MNHVVSVFQTPAFRHCSAEQVNRAMEDPEAAKAFAGEQAEEAAAARLVYHPAAAEFLRRQRNGERPFVPLSG